MDTVTLATAIISLFVIMSSQYIIRFYRLEFLKYKIRQNSRL